MSRELGIEGRPPARRPNLVARPTLLAQLDHAVEAELVVVTAPAGFGKTTLLVDWVSSREESCPVVWLALDATDAEPRTFWARVIAALSRVLPEADDLLDLIRMPEPPPIEAILTELASAFERWGGDAIVIVDDFHLVPLGDPTDALGVHRGMRFLVEHKPRRLHLVVASRQDPPLPLARMRARGTLVELRADALRLTSGESEEFLNQTMNLTLTRAQAARLQGRTEGWAAGLQLAGVALRAREAESEIDEFIEAFAGSQRFVIDYLAEEVLAEQPDEVVAFLARTCVLDRMCGALCDAMAEGGASFGGASGQEMVERLERDNLFVVALDDTRTWYRYHQLFADVLRAQLLSRFDESERVALHERASEWFESEGFVNEAIGHAVASGKLERVADLLEETTRMQFTTPIQQSLQAWLRALPADVIRRRPTLALIEAWRLLQLGDTHAASELVSAADAALALDSADEARERSTAIQGVLSVTRAFIMLALPEPDLDGVIAECRDALVRLEPDDHTFRGMTHMAMGHARLLAGDAAEAEQAFVLAESIGRRETAPHVVVMGSFYLAGTQRLVGRYRDAHQTARSASDWAAQHRLAVHGRVGLLRLMLADIALERGSREAALEDASEALSSSRRSGVPAMVGYAGVCLARVHRALGEPGAALDVLDETRAWLRNNQGGGGEDWVVIDALRAQLLLDQRNVAAAVKWAETLGESPPPRPLLLGPRPGSIVIAAVYECEHLRIAPAQAWLAAGRSDASRETLDRALQWLDAQAATAEAFELGWLRAKVQLLRALTHEALGETEAALELVSSALALTQPEGLVQLFAEEGRPLAALLTKLRLTRARSGEAQRNGHLDLVLRMCSEAGARGNKPGSGDAEPGLLTDRELDVLRLIIEGLSNAEIAQRLFLAPSTVKTHVNHVFSKLGVASRSQAIARARALGLL